MHNGSHGYGAGRSSRSWSAHVEILILVPRSLVEVEMS
jgi:hypothetical protein